MKQTQTNQLPLLIPAPAKWTHCHKAHSAAAFRTVWKQTINSQAFHLKFLFLIFLLLSNQRSQYVWGTSSRGFHHEETVRCHHISDRWWIAGSFRQRTEFTSNGLLSCGTCFHVYEGWCLWTIQMWQKLITRNRLQTVSQPIHDQSNFIRWIRKTYMDSQSESQHNNKELVRSHSKSLMITTSTVYFLLSSSWVVCLLILVTPLWSCCVVGTRWHTLPAYYSTSVYSCDCLSSMLCD